MRTIPLPPILIAVTLWSTSVEAADGATSCQAQAAATPPTVVELFTTEGCSSCPPADRWLSSLADDGRTLPLAFHVNYWDHLGWKDSMASPATTQRQRQWKATLAATYVYTPQVIVNGSDERRWRSHTAATLPRLAPTVVPGLRMERRGGQVVAHVSAVPDEHRLAGYWVVLEGQIRNKVTRGENAGRTLLHDHVVRLYRPEAAWAGTAPRQLTLDLGQDPAVARARVAFVVTAEDGLRPLQALSLSCS